MPSLHWFGHVLCFYSLWARLKLVYSNLYCCLLLSRVRLLQLHGRQPTRLLCLWDFPGKNTGMSCYFLLQGIFLTRDRTWVSWLAGRFTITKSPGKHSNLSSRLETWLVGVWASCVPLRGYSQISVDFFTELEYFLLQHSPFLDSLHTLQCTGEFSSWFFSPESQGFCWNLDTHSSILLCERAHPQGKVKESEVTQSCPTLCNPMDCSLPGSSVHGIFQGRVLEWVAISFSRGSSQPRDQIRVSLIACRCFTI